MTLPICSVRRALKCLWVCASAASLSVLGTLGGCADHGPHRPLVMHSPGADALAQTTKDADGTWPEAQWFASFHDKQLDALVDEACAGNPDIQVASARIAEAQSQLDQFASGTGLTGGAAVAAYKARMPAIDGAANVNVAGTTVPINLFSDPWVSPASVIVGANYELDLWGKNRALTQALVSARDAARVDAQQARLTIITSLVTLYGRLAYEYAKHDLLQARRHQADQLDAIRRTRETRGIDGSYGAQQEHIEQATLRMQLLANDDSITQTGLQIGALTGNGSERGLSLQRPTLADSDALSVPPNLPLELLGRRPDIVAAKLRVQAATAKIAATRAAFYPNINLSAAGGLASLSLGSLFSSASAFFALGPAVSLPIFERGQLRSQLRGDYAQADEMIATYNKTLDNALAEVARSIATMRNLTALIDEQKRIIAARERMLAVASERQRRGLIQQSDVLMQRMQLDEQLRLLELDAQRRDADVALIRALGGGFDAIQPRTSVASPVQPANLDLHEKMRDNRPSINPSSS
ncbi:efflux transporter outer membrane subunit [Paraburkholderia kirstenboschensis]|uniref:Efflux transporter outer membrane subunit n=1 Tax=Paraburkholderia kirstenboschensis TaxID=1245436 RepID=A0ABZ0EDJ5_9BURK|nr:efflux transporter outer membrane subunit [Paraburkholderia kirstenboschensis]WOD14312.1 efflux transporter outer membrane subunit [Paraburkholderia kirstenboschensis]